MRIGLFVEGEIVVMDWKSAVLVLVLVSPLLGTVEVLSCVIFVVLPRTSNVLYALLSSAGVRGQFYRQYSEAGYGSAIALRVSINFLGAVR